jgi:hypothetical protein
MEISKSSMDSPIQVAVQKQMLDQMQVQGASLVAMIGSASPGSVNLPGQGLRIDAQV